MAEFYWEIEQYDGTRISIPPQAVATVKQCLTDKLPIHTKAGSVLPSQVKYFRPTEQRFTSQPLLESAAQAFKQPLVTAEGGIQARWVKKLVPSAKYHSHYAKSPGYTLLKDDGGLATVAFRVATHDFNSATLDYCSDEEVSRLTRK